MWTNFILLLYLTTRISGEVHHPQVYEDQVENAQNSNEKIRTARNPEFTYRTIHEPPTFSYNAAQQQDYLKNRYAQQQKVDLQRMFNKYPNSQNFLNQPVDSAINENQVYDGLQGSKESEEQWHPFSLGTAKQELGRQQDLSYLRITEDEANTFSTEKNNILIQNRGINKNNIKVYAEDIFSADDQDAQGSEIVEDKLKIDRQDSPTSHGQIVYMNPNLLKQNLNKNSQQQILGNYDTSVKKPDTQLRVLNELIGKNPNVQLEGLKRLLQETPAQNFIMPVVRGPQPFQLRNHTPMSDQTVDISNSQSRPNIQMNHLIIPPQIPQIPHIVNKESLADLQKQFDEHSRIQTQQVLARAQQEAQAHVEAQHKAIALAQAQAQKTALESIQKSLYANAQAVPEVQQNIQAQALVRAPPRPSNILPVPTNKDMSYSSHKPTAEKQPLPTNVRHDSPINDHPPQASTYAQVIKLPPGNIAVTATHKNVPLHAHGSENLLYYAPSHQHQQVVAQPQAPLVHVQNNALLRAHGEPLAGHHEFGTQGSQANIDDDGIAGINSLAHQEPPTATTYQQFVLETNPSEQEEHDDIDDLQYAAKYAFGYRIKDVKEGNDFGHEERRNGKSAEGSYHVLLPDGRLQKVEYYADNSGYHAKVTYEHVAHH